MSRARVTHYEGDDCPPDGHAADIAAAQAADWARTAALRSAGCTIEITPTDEPAAGNRIVWRCAACDATGGGRDVDSADADARNHAYEVLVERWHDGDDPRPLHEYLGMTWQRYCQWATTDHARCVRRGAPRGPHEPGKPAETCAFCAPTDPGRDTGTYDTTGERP